MRIFLLLHMFTDQNFLILNWRIILFHETRFCINALHLWMIRKSCHMLHMEACLFGGIFHDVNMDDSSYHNFHGRYHEFSP